MSQVHLKGFARVEANLTPMIDVTFLLIVFFVLVSQIVEVEKVPMSLPAPIDPASEVAGDGARAVINVLPGPAGDIRGYRLGSRSFDAGEGGTGALADHLRELLAGNPHLAVNVRADRATHYRHVQPVLEAVSKAAAGVPDADVTARINLVVLREE